MILLTLLFLNINFICIIIIIIITIKFCYNNNPLLLSLLLYCSYNLRNIIVTAVDKKNAKYSLADLVTGNQLQLGISTIEQQITAYNNINDNNDNSKLQNLFAIREMSYDKLNLIIEVFIYYYL